jgi:hypothetical protein
MKKRQLITPQNIAPPEISQHCSIHSLPGKCQGLVANRKIEALSTTLFSEASVLAIPSTMDETDDLALGVWLEEYLREFLPRLQQRRSKLYSS